MTILEGEADDIGNVHQDKRFSWRRRVQVGPPLQLPKSVAWFCPFADRRASPVVGWRAELEDPARNQLTAQEPVNSRVDRPLFSICRDQVLSISDQDSERPVPVFSKAPWYLW